MKQPPRYLLIWQGKPELYPAGVTPNIYEQTYQDRTEAIAAARISAQHGHTVCLYETLPVDLT